MNAEEIVEAYESFFAELLDYYLNHVMADLQRVQALAERELDVWWYNPS